MDKFSHKEYYDKLNSYIHPLAYDLIKAVLILKGKELICINNIQSINDSQWKIKMQYLSNHLNINSQTIDGNVTITLRTSKKKILELIVKHGNSEHKIKYSKEGIL